MRVLAVDDNDLNLRLLEGVLGSHGHTVRTISDPAQALAIAKEFRPQLILLDIAMPDRDGVEVMRELRACPEMGEIPIHALTAHTPLDGDLPVGPGAFTSVVRKPCSMEALLTLAGESNPA